VAGEQINIKPLFESQSVPCDGQAGDLLVITPLKEGEIDGHPQGVATLWFCIKSRTGERNATWARVSFDGVATCEQPVPLPPQNRPTLRRG
jgi:hypothetical protein